MTSDPLEQIKSIIDQSLGNALKGFKIDVPQHHIGDCPNCTSWIKENMKAPEAAKVVTVHHAPEETMTCPTCGPEIMGLINREVDNRWNNEIKWRLTPKSKQGSTVNALSAISTNDAFAWSGAEV